MQHTNSKTAVESPVNIGVLSYQGSVAEHMKMLRRLQGVRATEVKTLPALMGVDALILPGGESTTIAKLLRHFGLMDPVRTRIQNGMPVWGTCAGLILLAKTIEGEQPHLGVMDISVRRNAYGRQIDSFADSAVIPAFSAKPVPLVFIRAPWIDGVSGDCEALCTLNGHIVAARQRNMLATAFHPELTSDDSVHRYFVQMAACSAEKRG